MRSENIGNFTYSVKKINGRTTRNEQIPGVNTQEIINQLAIKFGTQARLIIILRNKNPPKIKKHFFP